MDVAVTNLTKTFGSLRANDGLSLRFEAGKIHGVLGENGAGKSTLMKLISGFLRPSEGAILLDDKPVTLGSPGEALRAGVGMVHQEPLDVPAFTALENMLCASPRWALPNWSEARATLTLLAGKLRFTLDPDMPITSLTVGQRQQLEIVRLLACGARALILDEPTTGITAAQARELFAALRQLAADGNTVLFVSHKLDEVAALCDTVSVLRAGRVVGEQLAMPQPQATMIELMFGFDLTVKQGSSEITSQSDRAEGTGASAAPREAVLPQPSDRSTPRPAPAWRFEGVTARTGAVTVSNLTLELPTGRVIGLAGLDGSGQQILLRLLAGRMRPEQGRVLVNGADLTGAPALAYRRAGIEYLPADRMLDGVVGALSLSEHFALLQGEGLSIDRRAAERAAHEAITAYGIKATPVTPLMALSGGNQQRAMLALVPDGTRGLACEQPTRGLDVASARAIWRRLLERRNAGCAVVFASADLDELLEYSDAVLVFFAGRVSPLLSRAELSSGRLAELIGGVGFTEG